MRAGLRAEAGQGPGGRAARRAMPGTLLLLAGGLLVLLPGLASIEVRFRTDARYLEAAREMFELGSWGVPLLAGVPHLTKPPLAYWAGALGYTLFGMGPFGGRCPAAAAVLGTALLVFRFARRTLPEEAALVPGGVVIGSLLPFGMAHALSTDPFLLLALTGTILSLADAVEGRRAGRSLVAVGIWLGLAVLAKGPVGPLLVGASWGVFRLTGGPKLQVGWRARTLALSAFAAISTPWFVWIEFHLPGTLGWMAGHEFLGRLGSGGPGHPGPWYALFAAWIAGAFPFSPLLLGVLLRFDAASRRFGGEASWHLLWVASWLPVVLLSFPRGKLPTYILPVLPPAAVLLARATSSGGLDSRWARWAMATGFLGVAALAGLLLVGLIAPGIAAQRLPGVDPGALGRGALLPGAALAVCAAALGGGWRALRRSPPARSVPLLAGLSSIALALAVAGVGPALQGTREGAELARRIPDVRVVHFRTFLPSFLFYFGDVERTLIAGFRPISPPHVPTPSRVRLTAEEGLAALGASQPTLLLVKVGDAGQLVGQTGGSLLWCGRKHCLIANPAAAAGAGQASGASRPPPFADRPCARRSEREGEDLRWDAGRLRVPEGGAVPAGRGRDRGNPQGAGGRPRKPPRRRLAPSRAGSGPSGRRGNPAVGALSRGLDPRGARPRAIQGETPGPGEPWPWRQALPPADPAAGVPPPEELATGSSTVATRSIRSS